MNKSQILKLAAVLFIGSIGAAISIFAVSILAPAIFVFGLLVAGIASFLVYIDFPQRESQGDFARVVVTALSFIPAVASIFCLFLGAFHFVVSGGPAGGWEILAGVGFGVMAITGFWAGLRK